MVVRAELGEPVLVQRGYRYADHISYSVPDSLEQLHGPTVGVVRVQGHIDTSLDPTYELSDAARRWSLYSRVVRDGTSVDQAEILNRPMLEALWPELNLPERCRSLWEEKFPTLTAAVGQLA